MKHLTLTLLFSIFSFFGFSQNYKIVEAQKEVYADQIGDNHFIVTYVQENSVQTGEFIREDDKMIRHGNWTLRTHNKKVMTGKFDEGNLIKLTVYTDAGKKILTQTDIEIFRLKSRIYRLENELAFTNSSNL